MKFLKNKNGFTLVETIAAVAVFSIVSIILLTGFTIVARLISRSNTIKQESIQGEYEIESKSITGEGAQSETIRIQIQGETDVTIEGYYIEETNEYSEYKVFVHK